MSDTIARINEPELFLGFVAPIGTDVASSHRFIAQYFQAAGYRVVPIKVTDVFERISRYLPPKEPLDRSSEEKRLQTFIRFGNQIRETFDDDQILSALTIVRVIQERIRLAGSGTVPERNVFLLSQFKRKEEIELLRSIYEVDPGNRTKR